MQQGRPCQASFAYRNIAPKLAALTEDLLFGDI